MIAIIDYGMGNLHSVYNALHTIGADVCITRDPKIIANADKMVLPGVGAFYDCMKNLHDYQLIDVLNEEVCGKKKPLLGICLGMQALFSYGEEKGGIKGLGYLKGRVVKMEDTSVKIPHIGWNLLEANKEHPLFSKLSKRPFVYYVHSYFAQAYDKEILLGYSTYGNQHIAGLICQNNILAAQFHPEKSGEDGLRILRYFKEEFA